MKEMFSKELKELKEVAIKELTKFKNTLEKDMEILSNPDNIYAVRFLNGAKRITEIKHLDTLKQAREYAKATMYEKGYLCAELYAMTPLETFTNQYLEIQKGEKPKEDKEDTPKNKYKA